MQGVIQGGWSYVAAAYVISLGLLGVYVYLVESRLRAARLRHQRGDQS